MKVLLAFDSFKETLAANLVCEAVAAGLQSARQGSDELEVRSLPLSDGGEGFVAALAPSRTLTEHNVTVTGPLGDPISSSYATYQEGDRLVAIIEMARAAGLEMVPPAERNPLHTTAAGVGQLIEDAIKAGCKKIILGLGGSATSEGGVSLLPSLGVKVSLHSPEETPFVLYGKDLARVESISLEKNQKICKDVEFEIAVDVMNPFVGPNGAVAIFSPQKGADPAIQQILESAMSQWNTLLCEQFGVDLAMTPGAGAAGGISGLLLAVLDNVQLKSGAEVIADAVHLDEAVEWADVVITGEGCYDAQTAGGKVAQSLIDLCKVRSTPSVIMCGRSDLPPSDQQQVCDLLSFCGEESAMKDTYNSLQNLAAQHVYTLLQTILQEIEK